MSTVTMHEAEASLATLVRKLETGEESEIIIARDGKPVARLLMAAAPAGGLRLGLAEGRWPAFDFDAFEESDKEIQAMFLGEQAR